MKQNQSQETVHMVGEPQMFRAGNWEERDAGERVLVLAEV